MKRILILCAAVIALVAGEANAQTSVANRTATAPGNRNTGSDFLYLIRFVAPSSGTVDTIGGSFRDGADGADDLTFVLYSADGTSGAPGTWRDSTTLATINNSSSSTHAEVKAQTTVGYSIVSGTSYFVGVWAKTAEIVGNCGLARDGDATGDNGTFTLDSLWFGGDAPPLAATAPSMTQNAESAACLFLVVTSSGGGGGSGPRVLIRNR